MRWPFLLGFLLAFQSVASSASAPERVYVGAFLNDVSAFDLKAGEFKADVTVWCKWRGPDVIPPLSFTNGEIENRDELARESDGDWRMVRWRVQGTFRGMFPLHRFPFDEQQLKLELALDDPARTLVPDLAASGMNPAFSITGWLYDPFFAAEMSESTLASDLGSVRHEGEPHAVKTVALVLTLRRPFASYVIKFVLPLMIIVSMALLSFFLGASELEVRAGMVVTALLSCVAFHFSQADSLPDVPYLVAADRVFLTGYITILFALIATVVSFRVHANSPERSRTIDRRAVGALGAGIALAMVVILLGARHRPAPPAATSLAGLPRTTLPDGPLLRVGVSAIGFNAALTSLRCRGLSGHDSTGGRVPHALEEYPDMTNSSVRLLPNGGMMVFWTLRPGLRFSDGAEISSQDLLFSMQLYEHADRVELVAIDDLTVRATWRKRTPAAFVERTLLPAAAVADSFAKGGREAVLARMKTDPPPCDGPFQLEKLEPEKFARLVRNPWFAGEAPKLGAVELLLHKSAVELADALLAGKIDLAPTIAISGLEKLRGNDRFETRVEPAPVLYVLQPDLKVPALAKPDVRRAILMGIDRARYAQELFGDPTLVADSWVAPSEPDHVAVPRVPYDPKAARALLAASGAAGVTIPIFFQQVADDTPQGRANALLFAALKELGISPDLKPMKSGIQDLLGSGDHGGLALHSRGTTVPDRFFGAPMRGNRHDPTFRAPHFTEETSRLLGTWMDSLFPERKESVSARLQRTFAEVLPNVPLSSGRDQSAYSRRLHGFAPVKRAPYWNSEVWTLDPLAAR